MIFMIACITAAQIVKMSSENNLQTQSKGIQKQIQNKINEINRMSIVKLQKQLDTTRVEGFGRNDNVLSNTLGIHAMKQGSLLDGYATIDLLSDQNDKSTPGNKRGIFQTKYKKGTLVELTFIGVGDTHGNGIRLDKDISRSDQSKYLMITNANSQRVGILKV
jgi:hypothetical protein